MVLTLVDLTQVLHARRVEENLARSQAEFQQLGESIDDALLIVDRELSRSLYLNPSVPEVFGVSAAQLKANPACFLEACDPVEAADLRNLCRVLQVHKPQTKELTRRLADQSHQILRVRVTSLKSRPEFILMVCEDVTALRQAQQRQQAEIEQQREVLVREVHHRIKNNLQGVAGLLQQRARQRPELATEMAMASAQNHAIAQVHGLQLKGKGMTDLIALLEAVSAIHQSHAANRSLEVRMAVPAQGPRPLINEPEAVPVALILNELLSNAVQHATGPGKLEIGLNALKPGSWSLTIRNPGKLPPNFSFEAVAPGATGFGLIKAMMPRSGARMLIQTIDHRVQLDWELAAPTLVAQS
jgi:PAS domain S-box-containing protein